MCGTARSSGVYLKMHNIGILGYGTVGSGVAEVAKETGFLHVKYILDIREIPGVSNIVNDINILINDPEIKVICETMGGKEPAFTYTKLALEKGISVCTSNKELVDAHGVELSKIAEAHNCNYLFEASVGGGIPVLRSLRQSCSHEKITNVTGILNGTCNYILTRMKSGQEFDDALKEAQANGFAERNPAADIEGHDTARKIAILASLVSGKKISYEKVLCEGITNISGRDFAYAEKLNMSIKLLGVYDSSQNKNYVLTAPFLVSAEHPLYNVNGVFNGIMIHGTMIDNLMFYGRGAGKLPTASAVISDVIECIKETGRNIYNGLNEEILNVSDINQRRDKFFVRV